jgi:hypothetical protein
MRAVARGGTIDAPLTTGGLSDVVDSTDAPSSVRTGAPLSIVLPIGVFAGLESHRTAEITITAARTMPVTTSQKRAFDSLAFLSLSSWTEYTLLRTGRFCLGTAMAGKAPFRKFMLP